MCLLPPGPACPLSPCSPNPAGHGLTLIMASNVDSVSSLEDLTKCKGMTLCHWNIRSLTPDIDEVTRALIKSKAEFFTISETWLDSTDSDESVWMSGYNLQRFDRTAASNKSS